MCKRHPYQYLISANSMSSTHNWSFCSHHLYICFLPIILVLSHDTLPQSVSRKVPGASSWFSSPLVTCSTSFCSYSKARTAQKQNQKGLLKKRPNIFRNRKSTGGNTGEYRLQASTWAVSHPYSKRGRALQSVMKATAAVCCRLSCFVIRRQRKLHSLKWWRQSEITK